MQTARLLSEVSETRCITDAAVRVQQIKSVLSRGLPVCKMEMPRDGKVAIVASGPSINDYRKELTEFDGEIWAINGAYDFLRDSFWRTPEGFVGVDPQREMVDILKCPGFSTTYYLASCCHPDLFDHLSGHNVKVWHSNSDTVDCLPSGSVCVPGGITCVSRAPFLAYMQGWRDITIYGADSSYRDGEYYAFPGDKTEREKAAGIAVKVGGRVFQTEVGYLHQASDLGRTQEVFEERLRDARLTFRCGGLLPAFLSSLRTEDSAHG